MMRRPSIPTPKPPSTILYPLVATLLVAALLVAAPLAADVEPVVMIADDEPGEPLVVRGTVYAEDGTTPMAGAELEVYHTDTEGHYGDDGEGRARIRAVLVTDEKGRYAYRTIRPAHYAGGGPPAHVHYVIRAPGFPEQRAALHFADDPQLGDRARGRAGEPFYSVCPVERDDGGVWHCVRDLRLER